MQRPGRRPPSGRRARDSIRAVGPAGRRASGSCRSTARRGLRRGRRPDAGGPHRGGGGQRASSLPGAQPLAGPTPRLVRGSVAAAARTRNPTGTRRGALSARCSPYIASFRRGSGSVVKRDQGLRHIEGGTPRTTGSGSGPSASTRRSTRCSRPRIPAPPASTPEQELDLVDALVGDP